MQYEKNHRSVELWPGRAASKKEWKALGDEGVYGAFKVTFRAWHVPELGTELFTKSAFWKEYKMNCIATPCSMVRG